MVLYYLLERWYLFKNFLLHFTCKWCELLIWFWKLKVNMGHNDGTAGWILWDQISQVMFAFLPLVALHSAEVLWCILCLWEKPEKCEWPASRCHMRRQVWHLMWMGSWASTSRLRGSSCGSIYLYLTSQMSLSIQAACERFSSVWIQLHTIKPSKTGLNFLLFTSLLWRFVRFLFYCCTVHRSKSRTRTFLSHQINSEVY